MTSTSPTMLGSTKQRTITSKARGDLGLQQPGVNYVSDVDNPWIPLTPMTDEVFVKYWKADPVRAELIGSIKMPGRVELPTHYHTGLVVAHTISGVWRCKEANWIARAGDTIYEVAGCARTLESFDDTEIFVYQVGETLFLDEDNTIRWRENPTTSIERYNRFCAHNGIRPRDLTGSQEASSSC